MILHFNCTFDTEVKQVKSYLRKNGYTLTSKKIKKYPTITVDTNTKEYGFESCYFFFDISVFWLFKAMVEN